MSLLVGRREREKTSKFIWKSFVTMGSLDTTGNMKLFTMADFRQSMKQNPLLDEVHIVNSFELVTREAHWRA